LLDNVSGPGAKPATSISLASLLTAALCCSCRGCTTATSDSNRSSSSSIRRASNPPTNSRSRPDTNHRPFSSSSSSSSSNTCHSRQDQSPLNSSNSYRAKPRAMAPSGAPRVLFPASTAVFPLSRPSPANMPPKRSRSGYSQPDFRSSSTARSQGRRCSNLPRIHSRHSLLLQRDTAERLPLQLERPRESQMVFDPYHDGSVF